MSKRKRLLSLWLIMTCLFCSLSLNVQPVETAFDISGTVLPFEDNYRIFLPLVMNSKSYSFFVAGHTYGIPNVNNPGVHPPFKALWPQLNSSAFTFGLFTGDTVIWSADTEWDEVDADLAELTSPVHFVVGNHDMTDRELFVSRYGPTYYSFEYANDLFVILDGEMNHCDIMGEQMTFLQTTIERDAWQNVFIFVHKLIWIVEGTPYYALADKINNVADYDVHANFWTEVEPLLSGLDAEVYVVAGDVGVTWAMSMFYQDVGNVHLIASGMGGSEEENYLHFYVNEVGVEITAHRLDGQPLAQGSLENYNLLYYSGVVNRQCTLAPAEYSKTTCPSTATRPGCDRQAIAWK